VVLDTNIIVYFLEGRLANPLPTGRLAVSVITEIELLSFERLDKPIESAIRTFLSRKAQVVALGSQIKEIAISLRRAHRLAIPDAVIAATAIALDTELLSNDVKLGGIPELRCRSLPTRNVDFP